jgi:hypothetical protein
MQMVIGELILVGLIKILFGVLNAEENGISLRKDYGLHQIENFGRRKYAEIAIQL